MTESVIQVEEDSIITDIYGNKIDVIEAVENAERNIEKLKSINV